MTESHQHRAAIQHVLTDKLLGLDVLPVEIAPAAPSASPQSPSQAGQGVTGQSNTLATADQARHGVLAHTQSPSAPVPSAAAPTPVTQRAASTPLEVQPIALAALSRDEKIEQLRAMHEGEVRDCQKCPLHQGRINAVFGEGDPDAPILFVGEGPGYHEDVQGRPFVGRSGELLDKQIAAMGLSREQIFIANVVKCRPPNNRTPIATEVHACRDYLQRQIAIIQPKVIITLGGPAAKLLLETDTGITRLRGQWHAYRGVEPHIPVMPTFHPAYLLRQYTKDNRMKVWSDLQQAMEKIK